ncbi:MAG: S8 family serine peptidase [Methylobacterium frigidaeris]
MRVLVAPVEDTSAVRLGRALHRAIAEYRATLGPAVPGPADLNWEGFPLRRIPPSVSPLENFVAVTLYFDELLRLVLPLTTWWDEKNLGALRRTASRGSGVATALRRAITIKLGHDGDSGGSVGMLRSTVPDEPGTPAARGSFPDWRVIEAAPLAALVGVFRAAQTDPTLFDGLPPVTDRQDPEGGRRFAHWVHGRAEQIADAALGELNRPVPPTLAYSEARSGMAAPAAPVPVAEPDEPPRLISRVFLDRKARLAHDADAIQTVKADAARRVFDLSCRGVTWAIIDSGIAANHAAFIDHGATDRRGRPLPEGERPTRVRAIFDFTLIDRIRNFDLVADGPAGPGRAAEIAAVARQLAALPGRGDPAGFERLARAHLERIADQLADGFQPDWNLIEPLIAAAPDDGDSLTSDHGTHVAGTLGADWRERRILPDGTATETVVLQGVCPDIRLYDLRVIHPGDHEGTEFALVAALEFVQFLNARAGSAGPIVQGVNVSLSIPHEVRNYGCGATPVCVACDRLMLSGVVVVAAAGNRGWNEQETGFGNFVFCSITDPGNAQHILTVGSTHRLKPHTYGVSYFSSRGPTGDGRVKPDLVAPGEKIRGPIRGGADDQLDGTSMAAPFVSGAAALLMARHPELIGDAVRIKRVLCESATDLGRERYFQGHGLVDVLRALQSV